MDFDAVDGCRLYITTIKVMNFQEDIPSIPNEKFEEYYLLVYDLTSMQVATETGH